MGRRSLRATSHIHLTRLVRLGLNPVGIGAIIGCLLTAKTLSRIDLRFSPEVAAIHHLKYIRKGHVSPGGSRRFYSPLSPHAQAGVCTHPQG